MGVSCEKLLAEIEAGRIVTADQVREFVRFKPGVGMDEAKKLLEERMHRTDLEKLVAMVKAARYRLGEYAAGRCIVSAWAEETLRELDRIAGAGKP
jgi:hypothetical protein